MTSTRIHSVTCLALVLAVVALGPLLPISANALSPNLTINPTDTKPLSSINGAFDTILLVHVPTAVPPNPPIFNLLPAFVVQSVDFQFLNPDGSTNSGNLITCVVSGYPSRNTVVSCAGAFPQRVMPKVYPGANTGIYLIGWAIAGSMPGVYTLTYTVTGLFQGSTITLTASVQY